VTIIKKNAFQHCPLLREVKLPETLKEIESGAFKLCESLITINLPKSLKKIGKSAFFGCSALKNVEIPEKITELAFEVFSSCTSLSSVILPATIIKIGSLAFSCCESLEYIQLPPFLTKIGYNAFAYCTKLSKVEVPTSAFGRLSFYKMIKMLSDAIPGTVYVYSTHGCTPLGIFRASNRTWMPYRLVTGEMSCKLLFGRPLLFSATESKVKWSDQLQSIFESNMQAVEEMDPFTGLAPFMLAAVGTDSDLETVYHLLIEHPTTIYY